VRYRYPFPGGAEDLASGRVIIHRTGCPAYPVRLAQEIFLRCLEHSPRKTDLTLYDPCCGGAALLTVLGFLNYPLLRRVAASDVDPGAAALAEANLGLLTPDGLERRRLRLEELCRAYGKDSHREAVESARRLAGFLGPAAPERRVFVRDALSDAPPPGLDADIVFTDLPYGRMVSWETAGPPPTVDRLLDHLFEALPPGAVVAVSSDKPVTLRHPCFTRLEKISAGKRKVEIARRT